MLKEIRIRDLGVIDDATLRFAPGLNVLTGETGAGKTMVVQGLGLLLGGRATAALVREGASSAVVEGVLELPAEHAAVERALEAGGEVDQGELLLARSVADGGRSRAWVGGRNAPVGVLGEIGELVVAVHGQSDQWRLQRPDQHRAVLDDFGGAPLRKAGDRYATVYLGRQQVRRELNELTTKARDRAMRLDQLTTALEEIESVDPQPGEDVALAEESSRLEHLDALMLAAGGAHEAISGSDDLDDRSALTLLGQASASLARGIEHDAVLRDLRVRLDDLSVQLTDLAADIQGYVQNLDADPARVEQVQQRRAALNTLLRKYGRSVDEVLAWSAQAAQESNDLASSDERIEDLTLRSKALENELAEAARELSSQRSKAAVKLGKEVSAELAHLAMGSAKVSVQVTAKPGEYSSSGIDDVEIQLAANKGAKPRAVSKAASGGELSRVMLAIEVVTAAGGVPTFIFDEVDAGVGGSAALDIGARLKALAQHAQVIVVTHLGQVAAYADQHLVVHKQDDGHVTVSDVAVVEGDRRRRELARMLGGVSDSPAALAHVDDLLAQVATSRASSR
ncbi:MULTISPECIES: DNA repair protein RecN [Yimella]|uniref:DNA repair protein RecN n=1 Tax=Yimella lutea TaxID=587872 RepID=A0A542EI94_9MICO|nr:MULTISPECIES: DNA repair protein RecN [Yimella]MCG8655101.1 DNA repair protein RecN [Yimella sp. NH-Cas1]TQJ15055.1 DNA replication and repair protein RecN [Yimella lutea]